MNRAALSSLAILLLVGAPEPNRIVAADSPGTVWKTHEVRLQNGRAGAISVPAQLQIVTEPWNRVVAVPYLVYMPEKDRLLMLVNCDGPHEAMVMSSDDRGNSWSEPRRLVPGKTLGMGVALAYLGQGNVMLYAGNQRWFSSDYGVTWDASVALDAAPDGKPWYIWDSPLVDRADAKEAAKHLVETGYSAVGEPGHGPGYQRACLRSSDDGGRTWTPGVCPPQWNGVSEVSIAQAANGDWVGACRTDIPASLKSETLDHYEGLGVSISKDRGKTWSDVQRLYDWGRHHPSILLMPNRDLVMTYVVRKGYINAPDGFPQFGIEAVVSHDNGQTWDLDHRYVLHSWVGKRSGEEAWWPSSQATSSVLLPDGSILTAFGTGFRSVAGKPNSPRDVGLVHWRPSDQKLNEDRTIRDAAVDSELRNVFDPAGMLPASNGLGK